MDEAVDHFVWARKLQCPPAACSSSVKKTLCKGVMVFLWEDISNSTFTMTEANKIRKNILLYKLKHGLNDSEITSVRDLNQLRCNNNALKQQIATLEKDYEEQDHIVRQKMQQLKDIRTRHSLIKNKKDLLKLKHGEVSKEMKSYSDIRKIHACLMPNTIKDIDEQKLRENMNIVAGLRSAVDKKQVWGKILNLLGGIDVQILWTHLYQALSKDLNVLMKLETENNSSHPFVEGENIDIGIARACGQCISVTLKRVLSNKKVERYQQSIIECIELIESSSQEDISSWLALTLEIKKLETEQARLQDELQKLKNNIQDNSSLNLDISQLTAEIETIDMQIDEYVKNIQQSRAVLNSTESLVFRAKEKLHCELQKIVALRAENYDPKCLDNALVAELDMFYNSSDLNALRKVMVKGDVGLYRHAICGMDAASVTVNSPQCSRIKSYFPMIHMPIYSLMECYKHVIANSVCTSLNCTTPTEDAECANKSVPPPRNCNDISMELLNYSKSVSDQARVEIEHFNTALKSWTNQDVQKAMILDQTKVDDMPFKVWLQNYNALLYMIQNTK